MSKCESLSNAAQSMPPHGNANSLRQMEMHGADELGCRFSSTLFVRHVARSRQDLRVPRVAFDAGRAPVLSHVSWPARAVVAFSRRATPVMVAHTAAPCEDPIGVYVGLAQTTKQKTSSSASCGARSSWPSRDRGNSSRSRSSSRCSNPEPARLRTRQDTNRELTHQFRR